MSILKLSEGNCKSCYKCLNSCAVKAIKMVNEQALIVDDRCIVCGHCVAVCPQKARKSESDVESIKKAISSNRKIIASIAPSFPGSFEMKNSTQLVTALKILGFNIIEETAIGAEVVSKLYRNCLINGNYKNFITTSCPSVNNLIEKYYPSLIKYMAPIVSPMIAHGKILKETYGAESFVVFVGPCVSKKAESKDEKYNNIVDAVLTFEELNEWLIEDNIDLMKLEYGEFNRNSVKIATRFPIVGGIIENLGDVKSIGLNPIQVDGIDECKELFNSIKEGKLTYVCVEANACKGGCIGGPSMAKSKAGYYEKQNKVSNYSNSKCTVKIKNGYSTLDENEFHTIFSDKEIKRKIASADELKNILNSMGKFNKQDELNCGGCGYSTCLEKAKAVYEGMSEAHMCLPYLKSKAESLKNVIFENSPNIIIIADENLKIIEINPKGEEIFKIKSLKAKDKPISSLVDESFFLKVKNDNIDLYSQRIETNDGATTLIASIRYLDIEKIFIAIMIDDTLHEENRKKLEFVRGQTFEAATEVINKQMRAAQEIASLLGETTAETKIILTKLKKLSYEEKGDL